MAAETGGAAGEPGAKSYSAAAPAPSPAPAVAPVPVPVPSSRNPTTSTVSLKSPSREEGELSSDEDAESPTCSSAPPDSNAPVEPVSISSEKSPVRSFKTGKVSSMAKMQPQTSSRRIYSRTFGKKHVPLTKSKNRTLTWQKKGADDNLVIKFSDDDSGSESGRSEPDTNVGRKDAAVGSEKSKVLTTFLQTQANMPGQATYQGIKQPSRKALVSSIAKTYMANPMHPVESVAIKDPNIRRNVSSIKPPASQVQASLLNSTLADTAVESLRHQIAERENELKGPKKSMAPSKGIVIHSSDHYLERLHQKTVSQACDSDLGAFDKTADVTPEHRLIKDSRLVEESRYNQCSDLSKRHALPISHRVSHTLDARSSCLKEKSAVGVVRTEKMNSKDRLDLGTRKRNLEVHEISLVPSKVLRTTSQDKETAVLSSATVFPLMADVRTHLKRDNTSKSVSDVSSSHVKYDKEVMLYPEIHKGREDLSYLSEKMIPSEAAKSASGLALETSYSPIGNHDASDINLHKSRSINHFISPGQVGILGQKSHLESLLQLEELQDKELEEAQEARRRCELEERRALKAYRKAQRALFDANERCAILYRKRELISAELQTSLLESSTSFCPSTWQEHEEYMLDSLKSLPSANCTSLPRLDSHLPEYRSDSQCSIEEQHDASYKFMNRYGSRTNSFAAPDGNTSGHRATVAREGLNTSVLYPNISANDDNDQLALDNRLLESREALPIQLGNHAQGAVVDAHKETLLSNEKAQDYDLLEASLRSKLVERFGMRMPSKISDVNNLKCQYDKVANGETNNTCSSLNHQSRGEERPYMPTSEGIAEAGGSISWMFSEQCGHSQENGFSLNLLSPKDYEPQESNNFLDKSCSSVCKPASTLPPSKLHLVLGRIFFLNPGCHRGVLSWKEGCRINNVTNEVLMGENIVEHNQGCLSKYGGVGYYISDSSIDPLWPFCMFELRGKCNDEECPRQHAKSLLRRELQKANLLETSFSGLEHHFLPIPAYCVGSAVIKADSQIFQSVLACSTWRYWQAGFSASFGFPLSIQRAFPPDAPLLQTDDGPILEYDGWNRHLYFRSQDRRMNKFVQGLPDCEQSLELALDLFSGKFHKPEIEQVLDNLSRAIEANTNSVPLWVAYLHLYYRNENGIRKDDMFVHAVQHNQCSYELWLMFINSRVHLSDRFNAYNDALSSLCRIEVTDDQDAKHKSAFLLDIFMQMIDFLSMSGSIEKVIEMINGLVPAAGFEFSGEKMLFDIVSCLTPPDRCIFWICCVYLATYEKLPDEVVLQLELEKDLPFEVEWPSVQLTPHRRYLAVELMKFTVERVASDINEKFLKGDWVALRSLHFLAVSHIKFLTALDGLGCSTELLVKYLNLYPTCIELVLMSARKQERCEGFEEMLHNWPKGAPGIHCLWNQYAEHALTSGTFTAEKLMEQWYQDLGEVKHPEGKILEDKADSFCNSSRGVQVSSGDRTKTDHTNLDDDMFRLLNLSLYRTLQNDYREARLAVDKALTLAASGNYKHCLREHSAFLLNGSEFSEGACHHRILRLISMYLGDPRFLPKLEPFSRRFYQRIKRSRLRSLIDEFLGPVSADFSLLNTVLEVSHGPSLLPEKGMDLKDLVDFVESIMDVTPGNYQLALSVCEFIAANYDCNSTGSCGTLLWAVSVVINSIFQAVPVAPECIWVKVANLLKNLPGKEIQERFHKQAISVYPFSLKLWKSYLALSKMSGNADAMTEAAKKRGLELDPL